MFWRKSKDYLFFSLDKKCQVCKDNELIIKFKYMSMLKNKKIFILSILSAFVLISGILLSSDYMRTLVADSKPVYAKNNLKEKENINSRYSDNTTWITQDLADKAYCDRESLLSGSQCVLNGKCFDYLQAHSFSGHTTDQMVFCKCQVSDCKSGEGVWSDCDKRYALCDVSVCGSASGVKAGESGVGEYTNQTTLGCCGDDRNEYFKKGKDNTSACCNSNSDIVAGGRCYAKNRLPAVK